MTKKGMRVLGLKIQDLQNIDIIDVEFKDHDFIEITGRNAAGKTTLINGLFGAIIGRKYFGTESWRVIKRGKDKALMKARIGNNERQIEIKRSITKKVSDDGSITTGGSLSIKDSDGNPLNQTFLDSLLSEFTVDPLGFSKKQPKEQIEIIERLGGVDVSGFDKRYKDVFEERTGVNRMVSQYMGSANQQKCEEVKSVDVIDLISEKEKIDDFNEEQGQRKDIIEEKEKTQSSDFAALEEARNQVEELNETILTIETRIETRIKDIVKLPKPEKEKSTEIVLNSIKNAGEVNRQAGQWDAYQQALELYQNGKIKADKLTKKLDKIKADKKKAITESNLPFKNIEFDETVGIVIDDVPFSRKSTAEQLRISTRIGTELYPDLRVLYIQDGSLLDEDSYKVLKQMAKKYEYQILVETVAGGPGEDTIIMRAGKVVSEFEPIKKTPEEQLEDMSDEL